MDLAYAAADLVVCRAGASSVTEAAAVGLPGDLRAAADRQRRAGAQRPAASSTPGERCWSPTPTSPPTWVAATRPGLATDAERLAAMGAAASALIPRDADEKLARIVLEAGR